MFGQFSRAHPAGHSPELAALALAHSSPTGRRATPSICREMLSSHPRTSAAAVLSTRLTAWRLVDRVSNTTSFACVNAKPISAASGAPDSLTVDTMRYRLVLAMSKTSSSVMTASAFRGPDHDDRVA